MSFETLRDRLPAVMAEGGSDAPWPRVGRGGVSFSDDLRRSPGGGRLGVRVRMTDRDDGGYIIDLRDSDPHEDGDRFALGAARVQTACLVAIGHALEQSPSRTWSSRIELLLDPQTWVGTDARATDPAALAFGMGRTIDAVLGALANAWPGRVGAGSCSLGAVVELRAEDRVLLTEILPGGEGGRPDRMGRDAWPGLVLPSHWAEPPSAEGVHIEGMLREGSGGTGKHSGGRGVIRSYRADRPVIACVAFDRVDNPPHGIDRAGPPMGTEIWLRSPGSDRPRAVEPWSHVELLPGGRLEVRTCGGAGWGFPGYGDIEWDPSEWFGSKASEPS